MPDPVGLLGLIGSPADVATFALVIHAYRKLRDRLSTVGAGIVAVGRQTENVHDDRLQFELDVDDSDVDTIIADGSGEWERL